eukprot:1997148-Pyramimonas_sp.AAC.1
MSESVAQRCSWSGPTTIPGPFGGSAGDRSQVRGDARAGPGPEGGDLESDGPAGEGELRGGGSCA